MQNDADCPYSQTSSFFSIFRARQLNYSTGISVSLIFHSPVHICRAGDTFHSPYAEYEFSPNLYKRNNLAYLHAVKNERLTSINTVTFWCCQGQCTTRSSPGLFVGGYNAPLPLRLWLWKQFAQTLFAQTFFSVLDGN